MEQPDILQQNGMTNNEMEMCVEIGFLLHIIGNCMS